MSRNDLDQLQSLHPLSNSDLFRIARHHRQTGFWRPILDWFDRDRRLIEDRIAAFGACHLEVGAGRHGRLRRLLRQSLKRGSSLRRFHLVVSSGQPTRGLALDDRVRVHAGALADLAVASGSIDSCHANVALDAAASSRLRQLLRPGGRLTVELALQPVGSFLQRMLSRQPANAGTGTIRMPPAARALRRDLRMAGFRITQTWTDRDCWWLVAVR